MLKSYFKIAVRNLRRNKLFSAINILGLATGMASAVLIMLWIQNEVSYDRFHKNSKSIYELWNRDVFDNRMQCWNNTPKVMGPTVKRDFPEVTDAVRTNNQWFVVTEGEKQLSLQSMIVDSGFLQMFSFPLVSGNLRTALTDPSSIVLTAKTAKILFGDKDAMNKQVKVDHDNYTVTAILKDLPVNTRFDFDYLLPWAITTRNGEDDKNWGNNSVNTFVQLQPKASEIAMNVKIRDITVRHSNGVKTEVFLHPMEKWHLYSNFTNGKIDGGRIEVVRLFGLIAFFILLIACINFMNLTTAQSAKRAKEVGIRKVSGANKGSLIGQFLGESMVIALIAGLLAMLFIQLSLPSFDWLVGKQLRMPYGNLFFWMAAVGFLLITGLLAGSYPAFFLSAAQPVHVLKGQFKRAHAAINPRKVLVVLQFTFAIILTICTFIVVQQIRYGQNRSTGYDRNKLMYHFLTGKLGENFPLIKNELLNSGIASSITKTSSPITEGWSDTWDFTWDGKVPGDKTDFENFCADDGFVKTAGLQLLQGRDLNPGVYPTDSTGMLLNESAVKAMGFKKPLGQVIMSDSVPFHVVGVIRDFVLRSPFEPIHPMVIRGLKGWFNVINIKLGPAHSVKENIAAAEKLFRKYNPEYPFEYHFADDQYAKKFDDTNRTANLSALFAGLTIFISCLGLFGLAAYTAENRIKEIGIRKVLGASVTRITTMLSQEFIQLVLISILIAVPIAWYAMSQWLDDFNYHTPLQWYVFVLAGLFSVLIAVITVSFQAIKAALSNPIKNLRTE